MGGAKIRRVGGKAGRRFARWCARAALLAGAALSAYPPTRLPAQAGHPPDKSPYHDIKRGRSLIISGGYLGGDHGVVGVGPAEGPTATARFEVTFSKALVFYLGGTYGRMKRNVADPTKNQASHISGPIYTDIGIVEGGGHLNLTGLKTWHGMAPYIGASAGVIIANDPPVDTSGYVFQAKARFGPEGGIRWYLGRRLALRTELRWMFWQLKYPLAYKQPSPDGSRVLPIDADDSEWTDHPWVTIGVAWTF